MKPALVLADAAVLDEWLAGSGQGVRSVMKLFSSGKGLERQRTVQILT